MALAPVLSRAAAAAPPPSGIRAPSRLLRPICPLSAVSGLLRAPFDRRSGHRMVGGDFESRPQPPAWAAEAVEALVPDALARYIRGPNSALEEDSEVDLENFSVASDGRPFVVGALCHPAGWGYVFEKVPTPREALLLQMCCPANIWRCVFKLYCGSCRDEAWPGATPELYLQVVGCAADRRAMQRLETAAAQCLAAALGSSSVVNKSIARFRAVPCGAE
mmetsp:Transcript_83500/g.260774  ORF Transcript_83500/g.260774 Transcript_83500/m.260774 type:complete len:220 (+) Transcript_83500:1-660(+)